MNKLYSMLQASVSIAALLFAPAIANAADVSNEGDLKSALQAGNDATLTADIVLTENLPEITSGNFTVEGNSHSISVGVNEEGVPTVFASGFNVGVDASVNFQNLTISNLSQAIINTGTIGRIDSVTFENNILTATDADATGGAISNNGSIGTISNSVFQGNHVVAEGGNAYGGAIANIGGGSLNLVNTSFYNNYAEVRGETAIDTEDTPATTVSAGGAIYSEGDVNITAQGQDVVFSGNKIVYPVLSEADSGDGKDEEGESGTEIVSDFDSNAITMSGGNLNLITDKGNIIFDDAIASLDTDYNMSISGDGEVTFNNTVGGIADFVLNSSNLTFGEEGSLSVNNYTASGSSVLTVQVDPDSLTASTINVAGDVVGTTQVVVMASSEKVLSPEQSILFVSASNDNKETAGDFVVYRVYGSPFMWVSKYIETEVEGGEENVGEGGDEETGDDTGETGGSDIDPVPGVDSNGIEKNDDSGSEVDEGGNTFGGWYLSMTDESNPNFRPMAPEIASFLALHSAALEQNRGVVNSIRNSVAANKFMLERYGVLYEDGYKTKAVSRIWVNPVYRYVELTAPQEVEATIAGFDMGLDLQADASNKLGLFGSYRYGTYDVGKDGYFKANMDSTLEISSYLLGLYYRYDYNNFWMFSTAYAGRQHADMETDDKVKAEADGTQFGAGVEMGYAFIPGQNWTLEPSLGIFYTGIDYDDMEDKYGKSADYSMLNQIEGEFGIKLERTIEHVYGYSKFYVKPSVVQTVNFGNEVKITHLGKVDTIDDQTLGRIEVGGRYAFDNKMSLYGYVNYTTGSDYDDVAAGLGFNYRWY